LLPIVGARSKAPIKHMGVPQTVAPANSSKDAAAQILL
jgi:hypothetical protein